MIEILEHHLQAQVPPAAAAECGPLRVTHLCTNVARSGAGRAAARLHRALAGEGVQSQVLVAQNFGARGNNIIEYNPLAPAPRALGRIFFRLARKWHRPSMRRAGAYFSPEWTLTGWRLPSQLPESNVVNLHWVADFLDFHSLPKLAARAPLVWTFHDMNAFTGGCHYSGSCDRYTAACGSCPQLKFSRGERDMTWRVARRKGRILANIPPPRLTIVCPSHWLAREARRSRLCGNFDIHVIPNGIDLSEFHPVDRAEARRQLGLPRKANIILFVAEYIEDPRKGYQFLLRALEAVRDISGLLLVTLGRGAPPPPAGVALRHLGSLHDAQKLCAAYGAADIFIISSLQDNLPNTVLEAMACGTPVVGFRAGGIGEAVVDGETGLLAPAGDAAALASAIRRALVGDRALTALGRQARARAMQEYDVKRQAGRYATLYRQLAARDAKIK